MLLHTIGRIASRKGLDNNLYPIQRKQPHTNTLIKFFETASKEQKAIFAQFNKILPHNLRKVEEQLIKAIIGEPLNYEEKQETYLNDFVENIGMILHITMPAIGDKIEIAIDDDQEQIEITIQDEALYELSKEETQDIRDELEYLCSELTGNLDALYPGEEPKVFGLREAEKDDSIIAMVIQIAEIEKAIRCLAYYASQNEISNDLYPISSRQTKADSELAEKILHVNEHASQESSHHVPMISWQLAAENIFPHNFSDLLERYHNNPIKTLDTEAATVDYDGHA